MGGRTATLDGGRRPEQSPRDDDRGRAGHRRRRGGRADTVIAVRDRSEVQGMSSGAGTIRGFFLRGGAMRRVWESLREVLDRDDPPRAIDIQSPTL